MSGIYKQRSLLTTVATGLTHSLPVCKKANVFYGTFPWQLAKSTNENTQILCTKFINNKRVIDWKKLRSYGSHTSRLTDVSTYQYKFNRNPEENKEMYMQVGRYVLNDKLIPKYTLHRNLPQIPV